MTMRKAHMFFAWSGPVFVGGFLVACYLTGMFPAKLGPHATPDEVAAWYTGHTTQIRIGAFLGMVFSAFYYAWGSTLAALTRKSEEGRPPILSYIQVAAVAVGVFNSVLVFFWTALCAFRPDVLEPALTRTLNDFLWILFEFEDFPLSLWAVAIGLAILVDKSPRPVFPRWSAWVNFFFAGLVMTAQFPIFFKTGPSAWNGAIGLYWPAAVFFTWIMVMSRLMVKAVDREYAERPEEGIAVAEHVDLPDRPAVAGDRVRVGAGALARS